MLFKVILLFWKTAVLMFNATCDLICTIVTEFSSYKRLGNLQSSNISCLGLKFADLCPKIFLEKSLGILAPNSPAAPCRLTSKQKTQHC